jgi:D-amino-acid dehydrogenase
MTAKSIIVLGAGVIGTTTAYKLAMDGHDVTVIDAEDGAAMMTSYANAGLVAPGHAFAWASPAAPKMMIRSQWRGDQAIRLRLRPSWRQWKWMLRFLRECTTARAHHNTAIKADLCRFSQLHLHRITHETGITYNGETGGLIYFYRNGDGYRAAAKKADLLRANGTTVEELSPRQMVGRDPGLFKVEPLIAGALFAPGDESGDAHLFTTALAEVARGKGVTFAFNTRIRRLVRDGDSITRVETDKGDFTADAYVLCLGVNSPDIVKPLGIDLPIYPVRGYSVTLPITDKAAAPRMGGIDEDNLLAYCPMGDRLRITATAEIGGYDRRFKPKDFKVMLEKARPLFAHCADFSQPRYWVGLRPMTPNGIPVVSQSPVDNLWLNVGHGHMGWTMASGCAAITADIIAGRTPNHDIGGLAYGHN